MNIISPFEFRLTAAGHALLHVLLPPRCPGCGVVLAPPSVSSGSPGLCGDCWSSMTLIAAPDYGLPFDYAVPGLLVFVLQAESRLPPCAPAFRYDDSCRNLILGFKHADRTDLAPLMGRCDPCWYSID